MPAKESTKPIDTRKSVRIVTKNEFITAIGLSDLTLKARKLLYVAMAQCRMGDMLFDTYEAKPAELAGLWGISDREVRKTADKTTDELMKQIIKTIDGDAWVKRHLVERAEYTAQKTLKIKLNGEMADLLLGLKKTDKFSKPPLWDFMRMKSKYSMAIWHVMQREMRSFSPGIAGAPIEFDLTLDELRQVTGTQEKLKQISEFKKRVLDKAIREIRENCLAIVDYRNIKKGKTITGFRFTARPLIEIDEQKFSLRQRKKIRRAELIRKKQDGTITEDEFDELDALTMELKQMVLEDIDNE